MASVSVHFVPTCQTPLPETIVPQDMNARYILLLYSGDADYRR